MTSERPRYQGGKIGDRDGFRLHEPEMDDEEYEAYRVAWHEEFPCRCEVPCHCQGPPEHKPRHVRILLLLPEEPPQLTPAAARALLRILLKVTNQEDPHAETD